MKIKLEIFAVGLIITGYSLLILSYADYFPIWDAWANAGTWITGAVHKPFSIFNFDHGGHPSMVYFFLLGISQYILPNNIYLMHTVNVGLSVLAIAAFYKILVFILPQKGYAAERYGTLFLYAFFPIIVGNALHINPDYGVLVFFVITLSLLINNRFGAAAISGIGLVFSKEPGIAIYAGMIILYYLLYKPSPKKYAFLLIPILLFVPATIYKIYFLAMPMFWIGDRLNSPESYRANWPSWNSAKIPFSYALGIFIINFNWILTLTVLVGSLIRKFKATKTYYFFLLLFAGVYFVSTYVKTFTNLRYFLPVYPLLLILFFMALVSFTQIWPRRFVLGVICVLFFLTNFFTLDPISKKIYGVFKFGNHEILKMTSITGECCGFGRDQIVYNLQFIPISSFTDDILNYIKVRPATAIAFNSMGGGNIMEVRVDPKTYRRTLRVNDVFMPKVVSWSFFSIKERPETIYFIDYPQSDSKEVLSYYLKEYDIGEKKVFEKNGYEIGLFRLSKKKV